LLLAATGGWWQSFHAGVQQTEVGVKATVQPALGAVEQRSGPSLANPSSSRSNIDWWYQSAQKYNGLLAEPFKIPLDSDQAVAEETLSGQNSLPAYRRTAMQIAELDGHLDVELHTVEVQGDGASASVADQVAARVVMYTEYGAPVYRQTRFYQRIGPDWRQIPPDAALWGPERSLETPSFVFHFRQNDAEVVMAVASQVDALYTTMRRNVGLPLTPSAEKLVIEVSVTQSPGNARYQPHNYERFMMADLLVVASPAVYLAPVDMTDADLLAQSLALPLITQVSMQASEQDQIRSAWQPMLKGLRLWQVWDMDLSLALWREEIVWWIYLDRPGAGSAQTVMLPRQYEALCASHALWMEAPTMLGIPLLCNGLDWQAWYTGAWGPRHPPVRLGQLAVPAPAGYAQEGTSIWGQTVALATLIDYAVTTYGRERLPVLVAGLGRYNTWETLLPAVYGVSPDEFEAGWQAYLATRYGVSLDTLIMN
jgi:hypothetical protein